MLSDPTPVLTVGAPPEPDHGPGAPSPFASAAWSAAETTGDPAVEPVPVLAGGGSPVSLAAYRLSAPHRADLDPATYLDVECCGAGETCAPAASSQDVPGQLPVLVLGSPAARRSEVTGSASPRAVDALVDIAREQGVAHGCRSLLAPWCVDQGSGARLRQALDARGALVQRRAYAHSIDLRGRTYAGFAAGLPRPVRLRREREGAAAAEAGHRVARLARDEWERERPAAARLAAQLGAGGVLAPDETGPWELLGRLAGGEADLQVWAAYRDGELRGCAAFLARGDVLWLAWRALAREPRGFPAGLYFSLLLHEVPRSAAEAGFSRLEYGVSASRAWVLRGCDATPVHSCLLPLALGSRDPDRDGGVMTRRTREAHRRER